MTDRPPRTDPPGRRQLKAWLKDETHAELRALAAYDRLSMTAWLETTIAERFRRLPKADKARLLADVARDTD